MKGKQKETAGDVFDKITDEHTKQIEEALSEIKSSAFAQARVNLCSKKVNEVLEKFRCSLSMTMSYTPEGEFHYKIIVIDKPAT